MSIGTSIKDLKPFGKGIKQKELWFQMSVIYYYSIKLVWSNLSIHQNIFIELNDIDSLEKILKDYFNIVFKDE